MSQFASQTLNEKVRSRANTEIERQESGDERIHLKNFRVILFE